MNPLMNPPENPYDYETYYDAPDGNRYHWDPDWSCWHVVLTKEQWDKLSHWEKYSWIYWSIACVIISIVFVL